MYGVFYFNPRLVISWQNDFLLVNANNFLVWKCLAIVFWFFPPVFPPLPTCDSSFCYLGAFTWYQNLYLLRVHLLPLLILYPEVLILCLWQHNHFHSNQLWSCKARIRLQVGNKQPGADELWRNKKSAIYMQILKVVKGSWEAKGRKEWIIKK